MNELKVGGENINDRVLEICNKGVDLLNDNKGVIVQTAIGATELAIGMKGLEYSRGLDNSFVYNASAITSMFGALNMYLGAYVKPVCNIFIRNPWIEDKIERGYINPEDRGKVKENFGPFSNNKIQVATQYFILGCKDLINDVKGLIKNKINNP